MPISECSLPEDASHSLTVWSSEPDTTVFPSGLQATLKTVPPKTGPASGGNSVLRISVANYQRKATKFRNIFFQGREDGVVLLRYGKFGIMEIPTRSRHDLR
jgi:hypothetical protein